MVQSDDGTRTSADSPATQAFVPKTEEEPAPHLEISLAEPAGSSGTLALAEGAAPRPTVPGYEILDVVGRGGMGVVYKARHLGLNRVVALKMILGGGHAGPQERARFKAEAEAVARLTHPHIVQIYDIGEAGGIPFFSLEFVDGGTLAERLDGTPQPAGLAAGLVEKLARAVHAAHSEGIVHRDLKPGNILLSGSGAKGPKAAPPGSGAQSQEMSSLSRQSPFVFPKIADFGLAKRLGEASRHTQAGAILGTPSYMAPEQAGASLRDVGPATDVYALGAILYELVTGRPPFKGPTPLDTVMQVLDLEPLPPTRLNPRVPCDLETICLKCLQKTPGRRYQTAEALAEDLGRFQEGEPIMARPVGWLERAGKWVRRRPAVAALSAALLAVVLAAFTLVLFALSREYDHRLRAEASQQDATNQALLARKAEWKAKEEKEAADLLRVRAEKGEADAVALGERAAKAEKEARDQLFNTLYAQAQAGRWSGKAGRRFDSLDALGKAAAMRPTLQLRNEAIACMTLPDVRVAREWGGSFPGNVSVAFDAAYERFARGDPDGNVSVRRATDDFELFRLKGPGHKCWEMSFDPTGTHLAVAHRHGPAPAVIRVWDLSREAKPLEVPGVQFDFTRDGAKLLAGGIDGRVYSYDLATGKPDGDFFGLSRPHQCRVSPAGDRLAISGVGGVRILDVATGKLLVSLSGAGNCLGISWHPDGKLLAGGSSDKNVHVWDAVTGKKVAVLEGHRHTVTKVQFSHDGGLLASESWDGTMRLWEVRTKKHLLSIFEDVGIAQRYAHPRYLGVRMAGAQIRLWELATGSECRILVETPRGPRAWEAAVHPDGRILAAPEEGGVGLWDLALGKRVGLLSGDNVMTLAFPKDGGELIAFGFGGPQQWPFALDAARPGLKAGPPELIRLDQPSPYGEVSPDGKVLITRLSNGTHLWDREAKKKIAALPHVGMNYVSVSPDGQWIASGTWQGSGIRIWRPDGKLAKELPIPRTAAPMFSPDGQWLLVRERNYKLYRVGTWELARQIERDQDIDVPGGAAFTPDGKTLAVTLSPLAVRLFETEAWSEIATLEANDVNLYGTLAFSRDGRFLVRTDENLIHQVWDLGAIRRQLAALKLDWDARPLPLNDDPRPLTLTVLPGSGKVAPSLSPAERWDRELALRRSAVKKNPKSALALNNLAWHFLKGPESRRDPAQALEHARRAVELSPKTYSFLNTLGLAQYRTKRYAEAVATLEANLADHKGNPLLAYDLCFLAMCHQQLGDTARAQERYDQSLALFRENLAKYGLVQREELMAFHAEAAALIVRIR